MGKGLLERLGFVAKPPMSMEVFREQVTEMLLLEHPDAQIERRNRDEIEVRWAFDPAAPLTYSVAQAYAWYLRNPRELVPAIGRIGSYILISSIAPTPEALTVIVQPAGYNPDAVADRPAITRPIVEGLLAVVVIDNAYGYQFLTGASLRDRLGMQEDALWERALNNTIDRLDLNDVPLDRVRGGELLRNDGLATSLLLFAPFWDAPGQKTPLVVAPVAPNKILVAPEADRRAVAFLRETMKRDPLDIHWRRFGGLLVRRNGAWEVLR